MFNQVFYKTHTVQAGFEGASLKPNTVESVVVVWLNETTEWLPSMLTAIFTRPDGSTMQVSSDVATVVQPQQTQYFSLPVSIQQVGVWILTLSVFEPFKKSTIEHTTVSFTILAPHEKPPLEPSYDIYPNIRGYQFTNSVEYMFNVRLTYTGGHGSGGDLWAEVPRIYQGIDESEDAYKVRLWDVTLDAVVAVVKEHEELAKARDHSNKHLDYMNQNYRGTRNVTIHIN